MTMRIHTVFPDEFPESWASDWGEDEYGLFMAFTYKGVRQNFRWIEPGTFLMGAPKSEPQRREQETQHTVTLSKGFWIAETVVTQELWEAVMGGNPSMFKGESRPVESVSWDDAQAFIRRLNGVKAELQLCLPTEAQWEYACRAGTYTPFSFGETISSEKANFRSTAPYNHEARSEHRGESIAVRSFPPNSWGLYEMHGNVLEWCNDLFDKYPNTAVVDPIGSQEGKHRILRGGSWNSHGSRCRSASRYQPGARRSSIGFRLARSSSRNLLVKASSNVTAVLFTHINDV